ncbi:MAG: DUF805 domain-containing protein [Comamonadaceae bacterium]|nr:MAG: DUF805 domain-containing protein [Comamonadaceae bacterium]
MNENVIEDLQAAVRTCLQKYADFDGRASRPEFWWFFVFQLGVYVVVSFLGSWLYFLAMLGLALPAIGVGVRRLHDIGKSGWLMLIALIPLFGGLVLLYFAAQPGQPSANAYGNPAAPIREPQGAAGQ